MKNYNYRVVLKGDTFGIHECYYSPNGEIQAISENPITPQAETVAQLTHEMNLMQVAFTKPVVDYKDFS